MKTYKKCIAVIPRPDLAVDPSKLVPFEICGKLFESKPGSFNPCCPDHQMYYEKHCVPKIKQDRTIPFEWFDLYSGKTIIIEDGREKEERLCRTCGGRLLTKRGIYGGYWMSHCLGCRESNVEMTYKTWQSTRDEFVKTKAEEQGMVPETYEIDGQIFDCYTMLRCEKCEEMTGFEAIEVHHVKPVHSLDPDDVELIWDFSNLVALCKDCHKKTHHGKPEPKITLDSFL